MYRLRKIIRKSQMECIHCGIPLVYKGMYKHNHLAFYRVFIKYIDNSIDYGYICNECIKEINDNSIKYLKLKLIS